MKRYVKNTIHILVTLLFVVSLIGYSQAQNVTSEPFRMIFASGSSLRFQNEIGKTLTLEVTSGTLNSSNCNLRIYEAGGKFSFTALKDATVKISYNGISTVHVSGDQNKESRVIPSGEIITSNVGNKIVIAWDITIEPWLPLMFILGMIGLFLCFAGPLYGIHQLKHKHYTDGFVTITLWTAIGVSLVIAWLWV